MREVLDDQRHGALRQGEGRGDRRADDRAIPADDGAEPAEFYVGAYPYPSPGGAVD